MSTGDLPNATVVMPPVAGTVDTRGWPFGLAGRGRTRVSKILHHTEVWQGFPSQENLIRQALGTVSRESEICFRFRIQTIRFERLPCIVPGCCHGNALPSCMGSPLAAATVLGPAKPAGIQVLVTAAPIRVCLIIIQFRESRGNNIIPPLFHESEVGPHCAVSAIWQRVRAGQIRKPKPGNHTLLHDYQEMISRRWDTNCLDPKGT